NPYDFENSKSHGAPRNPQLAGEPRGDPGLFLLGAYADARRHPRDDGVEISRIRRSAGERHMVMATTMSVMTPPKTTEGTVPRSFAARPDSKAPISFEEPMKI